MGVPSQPSSSTARTHPTSGTSLFYKITEHFKRDEGMQKCRDAETKRRREHRSPLLYLLPILQARHGQPLALTLFPLALHSD